MALRSTACSAGNNFEKAGKIFVEAIKKPTAHLAAPKLRSERPVERASGAATIALLRLVHASSNAIGVARLLGAFFRRGGHCRRRWREQLGFFTNH